MKALNNGFVVQINSPGSISAFTQKGSVLTFQYPCVSESTCAPFSVIAPRSILQIECWGGNGGAAKSDHVVPGGNGGYSTGKIQFTNKTNLFLYIGGMGKPSGPATFNGGGKGTSRSSSTNDGGLGGGSGGGGTDVRLQKGTDAGPVSSRIIVAGGGAGSEYYVQPNIGGFGGGFKAGDGSLTQFPYPLGSLTIATGASINAGGLSSDGTRGTLVNAAYTTIEGWGSGGGGGYYGGGAGTCSSGLTATGGGGSSFISGVSPSPIVTFKSQKYSFLSGSTIQGNNSIPAKLNGHGMIRITILSLGSFASNPTFNSKFLLVQTMVIITSNC